MQEPESLADPICWDLAGNKKHFRGTGERGNKPRAGVEHTRPRHNQCNTNLAGTSCVTVGCVRRGVFVAGVDERDLVAVASETVRGVVKLYPGDTKDVGYAFFD